MRRILGIILALGLFAWAQSVSVGVVVYPTRSGCDRFIVYTDMGYAVLQLCSIAIREPEEGDVIVGPFESFGFQSVLNVTKGVQYRVWVDNYWLSASRAVELYLTR